MLAFCKSQIADIPGRSELNADQMSGVFASAARHGTLRGNDAMSRHFSGNAEAAGGFFVGILSLGPLTKNELRADIR
jgi:hypothetical protein